MNHHRLHEQLKQTKKVMDDRSPTGFKDGDVAWVGGERYVVSQIQHEVNYKPPWFALQPDERMRRVAQSILDRNFYVAVKH